ncbi:MAG TPA: Rrf2 family transcriptional regulator [Chloroflexi bacterium]|nr:Rrf2 family transcriptional regulator [Chloroflexota bacterium]
MRLSTKGRYALRAVVDLALHADRDPVSRKEIAERQDISPHYMEQLFAKLRDAGLIEAIRGPGGGYLLARPPEQITVGEVVRAVEEILTPVPCLDPDCDLDCERAPTCPTRRIWQQLGQRASEYLDSLTIADLCEDARQLEEA